MTKLVRIENADTNTSVRVFVQTWDKGAPHEGENMAGSAPDTLASEVEIACGAESDFYIHATRYLVVKESA